MTDKSAQHPAERQLNLFIALFATRRYLTKSELRDIIEGYHGLSEAAFNRTFERDKAALTELGIRIDVGTDDVLSDEKNGYTIRREDIELPEILLSAEEATVLGAVARIWDQSGRAAHTLSSLRKLEAGGVTVRSDVSFFVEPRLNDTEPAFDTVWEAMRDREMLRFTYVDREGKKTNRNLEAWTMFNHRGGWYVVGRDCDKDDTRVFRLSRMSELTTNDKPASYTIPPGADYRELASAMFSQEKAGTAVVEIAKGHGLSLRRGAESIREIDNDRDEVSLGFYWADGIATEIAALGSHAKVISPPEVKSAVIKRLMRAGGQS